MGTGTPTRLANMPVRIRAIKPSSRTLDPELYRQNYFKALDRASEIVEKDFRDVTKTWHHKPEVRSIKTSDSRGNIGATVFVRDPSGIFHFVNKGTKAHIIRPKNAKVLYFRVPFAPKSLPLSLRANTGSRGNKAIFTSVVNHPGIKARRFDLIIARKNEATLAKEVDKEFRKITGR